MFVLLRTFAGTFFVATPLLSSFPGTLLAGEHPATNRMLGDKDAQGAQSVPTGGNWFGAP